MQLQSYKIKVRGLTFLWGNESVLQPKPIPLILTVRNSDTGDAVIIGTVTGQPRKKENLIVLKPGECYSIALGELAGVYGLCETDTQVECGLVAVEKN